jgi:hypothetical protein
MIQVRRPFLSHHRRARLENWAWLWLLRLWTCIAFRAPNLPSPRAVERLLLNILVIEIGERVRKPAPVGAGPARACGCNLRRAVIGSRVRHALRAPGLIERIGKLLALILALGEHVAHGVKRLARGLTRLFPILAQGACEPCVDGAARCVLSADTS